jgi:hypothetical protein
MYFTTPELRYKNSALVSWKREIYKHLGILQSFRCYLNLDGINVGSWIRIPLRSDINCMEDADLA